VVHKVCFFSCNNKFLVLRVIKLENVITVYELAAANILAMCLALFMSSRQSDLHSLWKIIATVLKPTCVGSVIFFRNRFPFRSSLKLQLKGTFRILNFRSINPCVLHGSNYEERVSLTTASCQTFITFQLSDFHDDSIESKLH
jgi:hypothetical protein